MSPKQRCRLDEVVGIIRKRITQKKLYRLPPIRQLASELHVDSSVVSEAVRVLRSEGVLSFRHGTPILVVVDRKGLEPSSRQDSARELYTHLTEGIEAGVWRVGTPLPRRKFFTINMHMSDHTVTKVYHRLCGEGLVHRRGKTFYVGPPGDQPASGRSNRPGIILIIMPKSSSWSALRNERTGKFIESFSQEAENHRVRLLSVVVDAKAVDLRRTGDTRRVDQVKDLIESVYDRFIGTLVIGRAAQYGVNIIEVCGILAQFPQPYVRFSGQEEPEELSFLGNYYCCIDSPDRFSRAAIEFLAEQGHRSICWVGSLGSGWNYQRAEVLRDAATTLPGVRFTTWREEANAFLSQWQTKGNGYLEELRRGNNARTTKTIRGLLDRISSKASEKVATPDSLKAALLNEGPEEWNDLGWPFTALFAPLVNARVTALIAPRDHAAAPIHDFITETLGIGIPDEVSLISYDNYLDEPELPVTTIDRGFNALGYRAFHAIYQDIPLGRGTGRTIATRPWVVHRGSSASLH